MYNFSTEPYRDDFDPNKHFHRVLFKPGKAVQARELTQLQTILQDQISKFAYHIFSQNTPVTGGTVTINKDCYYVKLLPEYNEVSIDVNNFLNRIIRDDTGVVLARVFAVAEEVVTNDVVTEPGTLVISYISGQHFEDGDVIYSADDANFSARLVYFSATGKSSVAHIDDGVFFVVNGYSYSNIQNPDGSYTKYSIGNFVGVQAQTVILDKYDSSPTLRIGLDINETVYDYINDVSLLDPAIGASNYQAPGADRYVILLTLQTRPLTLGEDQSFIELVRIENGEIKKQVNGTVYSVIDDYFAKRTSETNGNYIVNDFVFTPKAIQGNTSVYQLTIGKGVAYVNGYRVENQSDLGMISNRARTTANTTNASINFDYGNYFYVDTLNGFFDIKSLPKIDIHCVANNLVNTATTELYNSTLVGSAYIRNIEHYAGNVYRAFVTDIQTKNITGQVDIDSSSLLELKLANTIISTGNTCVSPIANAYTGVTISITSGSSAGDTRTITSSNANGWITVDSNFSEPITTSSKYILKFGTKDAECFVLNTSPLSNNISATINTQYGKERGFANNYAKLVEPTEPEMIWPIGYQFVKTLSDSTYTGNYSFGRMDFSNDGTLTISGNLPLGTEFPSSSAGRSLSADEILSSFLISNYDTGEVIDFDGINNTIVVANPPTSATITVAGATSSTKVNIIAKLSVIEGNNDNILRKKELYTGNTTNYSAGSSVENKTNIKFNPEYGQVYIPFAELVPITQIQSLYVCDVKRILKIYETSGPGVAPTATLSNVIDVTNYYTFNNGQKDSFYDHSYIQLKFGAPVRKGNLLVIFDYYEHSVNIGYFNIRSYVEKPTNKELYSEVVNTIYTSKNGDSYRMSDVLDFRPSRKNADANFVFENDYLMPNYLSRFTTDYEYYLGRKDILILSKDRVFEIIQGIPANFPKFPSLPDDCMDLAKITLDPYTAYVTGENDKITNISLQKIVHKTWKMKNISDLESRVNNIEYYTALSLLEKNAESLQIKDELGLNRFKYGILADDFSGLSVADTANIDYNCNIQKQQKILTAAHTVMNFPLSCSLLERNMGAIDGALLTQFAVSNKEKHNRFFSLPFTTTPIIEQKLASRTINVNPVAMINVIGNLSLSPPMDTYVDNLRLPSLLIADPAFKFYEPSDQVNLLSQSDWKEVVGSKSDEKLIKTEVVTDSAGGTTTTNTFETTWKESQTDRFGYYKKLDTNYIETNGFITNVNVMPFMRAQEIAFSVEGLLTNTPLNCYFDNVSVNQYIRLPNVLQVSPLTGRFKEGDIIGYKDNGNVFHRTGRILKISYLDVSYDTTVSSGTLNSRVAPAYLPKLKINLYVISDVDANITEYSSNGVICSVEFNSSGVYSTTTATGEIVKTLHSSGKIAELIDGEHLYHTLDISPRDYVALEKSETMGVNNNTYLPRSLPRSTLNLKINVTQIKLSPLASGTNNFYNNAIITIFNPNPIDGVWSSSSIISSYNGTTKIATLSTPLVIEESSAVIYSICRNTKAYYNTNVTTPTITTKDTALSFDLPMAMMSSRSGMFCGIFKVPGGTFYTGTRLFRVDNGIPGNVDSTTTYAESVFFASSLSTQSQSLQFASEIPGTDETQLRDRNSTRIDESYVPPPDVPPPPPRPPPPPINAVSDPLAQTFIIDSAQYPNGVFIKSISVFFRTRSEYSPITLHLTETLNGYPSTMVPNSRVVLDPAFVNISERPHYLDNSTKTFFEFSVPVYIKPNVLYAYVLRTPSMDYTCWLAAQNDFALPSTSKNLPTDADPTTTTKLSANPYVGTVFVSQNAMTWSAEQTKSLMFTAEACLFDITKTPDINFIVPNYKPLTRPIDFAGAFVDDDVTTIADLTYSTDRNLQYDMFNVSTSDFTPSLTKIEYKYDAIANSTGLLTGNKQLVNPGRYGTPSSDMFLTDGYGSRVINGSNNAFILTAALRSSEKWVSPFISDDGISLYTTKWLINELGVYDYTINIVDGGKNYSNTTTGVTIESTRGFGQSALADVEVDENGSIQRFIFSNNGTNYATRPKVILSTVCTANTTTSSNEMYFANTNGYISNGSIWMGQTIANNTGTSTTVISANNANGQVIIANAVFSTATNQLYTISGEATLSTGKPAIIVNCETCTNNGNALAKYISKKVVLAPGNEAGDLRVYYTAYRPLNTNIYIYYKILSSDDNLQFEDNYWQLMTPISNGTRYSSKRSDLIEYIAAPGVNSIANNNISYTHTNDDGTVNIYTTFNQFAIKVVLMTTDSTFVPFLSDIRAIALPPGTGMM